jgi:hypothetical protein
MKLKIALLATIPLVVAFATTPAAALTMKECSAKYQAAKADGSLNGMKWNDFRASQCSAEDVAEPAKNEEFVEEPEAPAARSPGGVLFPRAIDKKYADESPGKARMHTCVDAYHRNKEKGTLAGLKWIQKGGGYYSLCNARLKQT